MACRFFLVILCIGIVGGCDKSDSSSASNPAPTAQATVQAIPQPAPPPPPVKPADPIADFQKYAAVFVDELFIQSVPKTEKGKNFIMHMYKKESAKVDVRKTDSLISPIVGTIVIAQKFTGAGFDSTGVSQSMVGGDATDTFNFSLDGTEWKYINDHSSGSIAKQDVRDVTMENREGLSSATLNEDLSNDPRILKVVETAKAKLKLQTSGPSNGN